MAGSVRSTQICACGVRGRYKPADEGRNRRYLRCTECGRPATGGFQIRLRWKGALIETARDQRGQFFRSFIHAERVLDLMRADIEAGRFRPEDWIGPTARTLLWRNYLRAYLKREKARCKPATYDRKRSLARHLTWFDNQNIRDITTGMVEDFAALPCLELALAPKTRADLMSELRHIFRRAQDRGEITSAPRVPAVTVPDKAIAWLDHEATAAAFVKIPARHRPIFDFAFLYGCRVAEACALCWDKVDRAKGELRFARTFSRRRLAETTKVNREDTLPIFLEFGSWLASQPPGIGKTPVFRNPEALNPAGWYTPDFLNRVWRRACRAAGLPHIRLQNALRHSRGMQLLNEEGWDLADVGALLRHSDPKHTRRYARPGHARLKRLVDGGKVRRLRKEEGDG